MPALDQTCPGEEVAEHPGTRACSFQPGTQQVSGVREPISVLFVDQCSKATPTLRTALENMATLKMIVEAELDQNNHYSKVALVFVQNLELAETLSLINGLKLRFPTLRVLVAFEALNSATLRQLLDAGADAFVMHSAAPEDFCAALTALAQGGASIEKLTTQSDVAAEKLSAGMTRREVQILRLLSDGCSNKEVARHLNLSVRTVETHRLNLRRKTHTGRLHELVSLARHLKLAPPFGIEASEVARAA